MTALPARALLPMLFALTAASLLASASTAQWPAWRGPTATGSIATGQYPAQWSTNDIAWKVALPGKGGSTPIVWANRIYLTTPAEGQDAVVAFNLDGKQLWLAKLGSESPAKHRTLGSSCNASPVTDGSGLFVYFKSGRLAALELDGKVRWQINITEQYGQEKLFWDQGTSPVLTDRHVILTRLHGGESWIAGFDKTTGKLAWKQDRTHQTPTENDNGYTTPVLFKHQNRSALLIWGADRLSAHDADNGKLLWSCEGFNPDATGFWPAIASPVIHRDIAIVPVGRDDRPNQARVHGIRLGGAGDVTASHRAWKRDDLGVFVTALAEYDGKIYLLRHRGEIVCLDPATGKTLWTGELPRDRAPFYASPVIANGLLYAAREDGMVFTARVGEKLELLSQNPLGERIVATPVPIPNRLLLRGDNHLFCIATK